MHKNGKVEGTKRAQSAGDPSLNTRKMSRVAIIDTHCHLDMFGEDRDAVIERARDAGIESIITVSSDRESNSRNIAIAEQYDSVYTSVGVHPHDAKDCTEEAFSQIRRWAGSGRREKIIAVGETGLDYYYNHSPKDVQRDIFKRHLALARETGLPAIVHSREAEEETLEILKESEISKGVLHCFSGDSDMAERAMSMGFSISIAGPVTFKKAKRLQEVARLIPDDYLLVETDAPYLTPEPLRGKSNEPAFLVHTVEKIAELRGVSPEDIARITTLNAKRLFRIGELPVTGEIAYKIRNSLYLNITNRCTNRCSFCVKFHSDYVKGHNLRLSDEPTEEELRRAIGYPSGYREIVFCGYGEPLIRLDTVKALARWIKENGGYVRINTNGHGNLIHKRNIIPELAGSVDALSVSLDAQDEATYNRICEPAFKNAFQEVLSFLREARKYIPVVQATVVEINGVDIEQCRKISDELEVPLRVRTLDAVG
ncbi:MAG TPA: TatD family hydrolase [Thermodesulfovibrionales bacterium]|nr:TatD family hydrolase [Thermodesulfovibrionales bacterium]